ncbi:MAG: hypothetical protein EBS36_04730 [Actinobacteria bacterium]|nr:hypothetical protein [Actinomycetota bacterium]NBY15379.1 hypothetical protein [Actinomycetota bacterium]
MSTRTYASAQQSVWTYAPPGFLGSCFLAIGSLGIGWFPISANALQWPIVNFFQTQNLGIALARAFLVVGAALLIQAWLMVGLDAVKGRIEQIQTLHLALLSWCTPLLIAVPLFSRDVYSYYMQGQMQLSGHSPYTSGVAVVPGWFSSGVDPLWGDAPSPYGPVFLLIERFVAGITGESALTSVLYFRIFAVIGVALMCWQLPKLAQRHGINPIAALWLGALNPLVVFHFVAGAHNDSLMIGFALWGINKALDRKFANALFLITLALAIKPSAFVVLPFFGLWLLAVLTRETNWANRWRVIETRNVIEHNEAQNPEIEIVEKSQYTLVGKTLAVLAAVLGSVLILAIFSLLAGVHPFGWISALVRPGSVRSWLAPSTLIGMMSSNFFHVLGFASHADKIIMICRLVGLFFLAAGLIYILNSIQRRSITRSIALAFVVLVICSPAVQPWYLLWFIPLLAATGLTQKHLRVVVSFVVGFAIHDIANSAETGNSFLGFSDTVAIVISVLILLVAIISSPRERALLLGTAHDSGMLPTGVAELTRWNAMRFQ